MPEPIAHFVSHLPDDLPAEQIVDYVIANADDLRFPYCCGVQLQAPEAFE